MGFLSVKDALEVAQASTIIRVIAQRRGWLGLGAPQYLSLCVLPPAGPSRFTPPSLHCLSSFFFSPSFFSYKTTVFANGMAFINDPTHENKTRGKEKKREER